MRAETRLRDRALMHAKAFVRLSEEETARSRDFKGRRHRARNEDTSQPRKRERQSVRGSRTRKRQLGSRWCHRLLSYTAQATFRPNESVVLRFRSTFVGRHLPTSVIFSFRLSARTRTPAFRAAGATRGRFPRAERRDNAADGKIRGTWVEELSLRHCQYLSVCSNKRRGQ